MTIASFLSRRRRALALCGASVALHVLALSWVAPQLGLASAPRPASVPVTIEARLLMAPPPAGPVAVAAAVEPPARPKHKRAPSLPKMAPVAIAEPLAAGQGGAAEKLSDVQFIQPAAVEAEAPAVVVPVEPVAAQPEPAVPPPVARQYRADLPPSASITLDVTRTDADGTPWYGEAVMAWQLRGDSYRMQVEAGIRVLVARVNLVVLDSEGKVGASGFAPVTLTEKRRGRSLTTTHFSERDGRITFSATPASSAWLPGTQDKATVPLQLAAIARGDSGQLAGGIEMLVGDDRDASLFRFDVLGREELHTRLGKLQTWHLSRPPRAGAYGSRLDIWLAPAQGWYPVQIRNIEASGAVTTQTANKIVITDAGT
jgi:hypothetical protein